MIIIPARMASTRFPNKVLADINGLPMFIATAKQVEKLDNVAIATDSSKVVDIAKEYGFEAILTSNEHQSGTDRINEAAQKLLLDENEVIVNVQADEPFIEPSVVQKVIKRVKKAQELKEDIMMTSCYKLIDKSFATDPNHVKVIVDYQNYAIYFSRSKIPYDREEHLEYFGHLGIYGFTKRSLQEFCALPCSPLENIEKLEQLRAIYFGKKIAMIMVESRSFGIDMTEDLKKAL
ncbi:MAG: 3-deoxy-manno-octulosonate cytidylyltransferase, partial [Sulfurospirillaceae bacterium]|nr:3-deoxy-manno-octulosonate cytidylyltransferase [Sulfurospirillaceae bacterium]